MIDSILDRATSILERRFLKNAFLPVLVLLPATAMPTLLQGRRIDRVVAVWNPQPFATKAFVVAGYFIFCWFVAAIVASQWRNIIRLYEGYPLARFRALDRVGRDWYGQRSAEAEGHSRWHDQDVRYPAQDQVLPTRLGNVMLAAERYSYDRYRADLIVQWPRLYQVLPRETIQDVEDARATLEFLLVISLWWGAFSILAPFWSIRLGGAPAITLVSFALGAVGAYLAYLSAIEAAREYGDHLRAVFDVYRLTLLRALHVPAPNTAVEERARWEDLFEFFGRRNLPTWKYDHGVAEDPTPSTDVRSLGDVESSP